MLQRGDGGLTGHGRELIQKFVQGMSAFEIIKQVLEGHSCPPKHRGSYENLGVPYDDILFRVHLSLHLLRVYHRPRHSWRWLLSAIVPLSMRINRNLRRNGPFQPYPLYIWEGSWWHQVHCRF